MAPLFKDLLRRYLAVFNNGRTHLFNSSILSSRVVSDRTRNNEKRRWHKVYGTVRSLGDLMENDNLIESGDHNLLVYNGVTELSELVVKYAKAYLPKNEIILFATQYDSVDDIKSFLEDNGIDVSQHLADGTLLIIDAQRGYHGGRDAYGTFKMAMNLMSRAVKENLKGVTWFGDMGSFISLDKISELVNYELSCPTKYEDPLKTVCCYNREDFMQLDQGEQNTLIYHHSKSIFTS